MKLLCLHGNGTNNEVMNRETFDDIDENAAPLRHELEEEHDYEFVEGARGAPLSSRVPGIEVLSSPGSQYFGYYDPDSLSTLRESIELLDTYITSEGPFDGVLGFSAGAVLAALYLLERKRRGQQITLKFGIFVASANNANELAYLGLDSQDRETARIPIPTAHIWGAEDDSAPKGGRGISEMCDPVLRSTLVHSGGHEFPRSKDDLTNAAHVVQRTMQLAREQTS